MEALHYITSVRQEFLDALYTVYGEQCFLCNKKFSPEREPTIDHWIPQVEGRRRGWTSDLIHGIDNCRPMCKSCNANKGDRVPNDDGTLPPRDVRPAKTPRPDLCEACNNGRLLGQGQTCVVCGSYPQPLTAPKWLQVKPVECDHDEWYCWMCFIGHVPRVTSLEHLIYGGSK